MTGRPRLALALLLAGAGPVAADWKAPEEERGRPNPVATSPTALQKGRALYQKHCSTCHGDKGRGDGPAAAFNAEKPPDITDPDLQGRLTDGEVLWKITTGRRQEGEVLMPALAEKVPAEEDRWKLVLFVRTLRARQTP